MGRSNNMLKWFDCEHLPVHLQAVVRPIKKLAIDMQRDLPDCPERAAGLRKLLEAKDCMVRAALEKEGV